MRRVLLLLLLTAACAPPIPNQARIAAITSAAGVVAAEQRRSPTIDDIAWLRGCWVEHTGEGLVEEYWTAPAGGTMLGMSRTIRQDSTVSYELMLISVEEERLIFRATPGGQFTTEFSAAGSAGDSVVFVNPLHEFPQRIHYRRSVGDSLHARLEGPGVSGDRAFEIVMERMDCPGA